MIIKSKDISNKTGLKLERLRKEAGMTRPEMARVLEVTPGAYRKNEQGFSIPKPNALSKLIDQFGISMDWFLFDRGPKLYDDRIDKEEVEQQINQLKLEHENQFHQMRKQLEQDQEARIKELENQLQLARLKIREKEQQAYISGEQAGLPEDVRQMTNAMKKIPLLHYEILSQFHRFKKDNQKLFTE